MFKKQLKLNILIPLIILISGCSMLNQKDPDVIVTTEPMLTKGDGESEGEIDKIKSADDIDLDSIEAVSYTHLTLPTNREV